MAKKIGLYGGTFDPIHFGHLNLAVRLMESQQLDAVWFCPAKISPHKQNESPLSPEHRLQMLKLAIEGEPRFKILDTEIFREGPSYTIDTIQELLAVQSNKKDPDRLYLLMGEDAVAGFSKWKQPDEIVKLVPLLIAQRNFSSASLDPIENPMIRESVEKGAVKTPMFDLSSTEVRQRLKQKLYCSHLIPAKVLDYILKHRLYS